MAVKATSTVTLALAVDVKSVDTYYYQTASTASAPAKPTTANPSGWQTTEHAFDATKAIWSCQKTTLTDGTFYWGSVSKASAYEGSVVAWNKAQSAYDATQPIATKTYTGVIGTANNAADGSLYFAKVHPDSYDGVWQVKLRINVTAPVLYQEVVEVTVSGRANAYMAYDSVVHRSNSALAIYYLNLYRAKQAGITAGKGHALGFGLRSSTNPTNASYARTITVEVLDQVNCSVQLMDTAVKYAKMDGTGSTNYEALTELGINAYGQNASNNTNTSYSQQSPVKAGDNGIWGYSLVMQAADGRWNSIFTASSWNSTGTGKSRYTGGFVLGRILYSSGAGQQTNASGTTATYYRYSPNVTTSTTWDVYPFDLRYSTNCAQTLVSYKPVYLVGTVGADGLFYLDSTWWTQTLPNSEDGKVYVYIGESYSTYQVYLASSHTALVYRDGGIKTYDQAAASDAAKTATSYMFDVTGGGVMVHPKGDDDSGWKISSAIELLKDGVSHIWSGLSDGVALMRIGMQSFGNIVLSGLGYVQIRSGSSVVSHMGVLPGDDADVQLSEDAEVGTAYTLPTDMATLTSVDLAGTALSTSDYSVASGKLTLANTSAVQAVYASLTTTTTETVEVEEPVIDPETGEPVIDPETGEPVTETHTETITTTETAPAPLSASYVRSDGVGAAFGKQAERPELDVAMPARFEHPSNVLATHGTAGADTGFRAYRSDTGVGVRFEVGEGGVNHGVWSDVLNRWLVYANKSDTHIAPHIVDGDATSTSQFRVKRANYATTGSAPSSNVYGGYFGIQNKDGDLISYMESRRTTANLMQTRLVVRRKVSGADKYNVLNLGLDASGNAKIALDGTGAAAAWRSALNAVSKSGDTITGTLILSRSTDLNGTADNRPALIVGGLPTANHIEIDSNEIQAKSGAKATAALYLNDDGGDVYAMGHKVMTVAGDTFTGAVRHEASLYIRDGAINRDTATPSANQVGRSLVFEDVNGERIGFVRVDRETDGYTKLKIYVYSEDTKGNETYNGIQIDVNRSGTRSVSVSETAPWRSAFGLNDLFAIGSVDITASSIGHGGNTTVTGTAPSKSGYTPYAVRGWNFTGTTRQNWVNMWACYIDGTTVTLKLGNLHASDTANVTVRVYILYVKTVVL